MLETIAVILLAIWMGGLLLDVAGGLIHVLLVVALAIFALRFFKKAY